jgi:chromosome segregation ATPase
MTDDWAAFRSLEERVLEHNSRIEQLSPALSSRSVESPTGDITQNSLIKSQMNKIIGLSKALNEKEIELSEARREIKTFRRVREENIALKSQLSLLTERLASAERELQFKNRALSEQELRLKSLGGVESELGYSNHQREVLSNELDALQSSLKRSELVEEQLASEVRQRLQAEERAAILQEQVNCDHAKMSAYSRGLEEQLRELDYETVHLKTELTRSSGVIDKCQAEFSSLDSLRHELHLKREEVYSAGAELERERRTIQKLNREKEALEYKLREVALKAEGADPVMFMNKLKTRLDETQALHSSAVQEAGQFEGRVKAAENKLRLFRRAVRIRLERVAEWAEDQFFVDGVGFTETVSQDLELNKHWGALENALIKAKVAALQRIKEHVKRNKTMQRNTENIEGVALRLKAQLEAISAKVEDQERLGVKVQELKKLNKSKRKVAGDWEDKFMYSQSQLADLEEHLREVVAILKPHLSENDDKKTVKAMASSLVSSLIKQKALISESQYHLDDLRKETSLLRDQFSEERHKNEDAVSELSAKIERLTDLQAKNTKALGAKDEELRGLASANKVLTDEVLRQQADIAAAKEDGLRLKDLAFQHYKTCVALLRVLMPALHNLSELAAQKALCSNTLFKLEAEIKQFSWQLGLPQPQGIRRFRVIGAVVRAAIRLIRGQSKAETIRYCGITLKISPVVPDIPSLPYGDNDQHLIYSLLLNAERSFPKPMRVELPSVNPNIDALKRVFSLARDQVVISSGQAATSRQQQAEVLKEKQQDLSVISALKEKLTKLTYSVTEQSSEFASVVKSYAEVKVRNEELEASLTVLQLNTEAVSEQLIHIRGQYVELLADNELKSKHLETIEGTHERLQRELDDDIIR